MGGSFFEDFQKMCGVFYPKSGVFLGFWVVFWVGVFGLWVGVLGPWCSGHTAWQNPATSKSVLWNKWLDLKNKPMEKLIEQGIPEHRLRSLL